MPAIRLDVETFLFITMITIVVLLPLLVGIAIKLNEISGELRYLNREICRSEGEIRQYWKRKKRKLLLSFIPFVKNK